jgi:hypothetical protein
LAAERGICHHSSVIYAYIDPDLIPTQGIVILVRIIMGIQLTPVLRIFVAVNDQFPVKVFHSCHL